MTPRKVATTHSETIDDEMCVYEWTRREVHALNPTAARVWQMCDGRTTVSEIAAVLRAELGVPHADELVWLALTAFKEKRLIEGDLAAPPDRATLSRRALIAKLGLTAAMLPVVTSIIAPTALQAQSLGTQTFNATFAAQTFVVPAGVTSVIVDAYGAAGGITAPITGALGGRVQARIPVTPGESLTVNVGRQGGGYFSVTPGFGGFNGGGIGGTTAGPFTQSVGGGGGGASDVRRGGTRLVVAGGGGGAGTGEMPDSAGISPGGPGGNTIGANGTAASVSGAGGGGGGGTQSAGGSAGAAGDSGSAGGSGSAGNGGAGANGVGFGGGGGGGGYYGGGGGGSSTLSPSGGGGGGSSYTDPGATSVTHTQGTRNSNGVIIISW